MRRVAFTLVVARLLPERKVGCLSAARLVPRMTSAMSIPVGIVVSPVVGHCYVKFLRSRVINVGLVGIGLVVLGLRLGALGLGRVLRIAITTLSLANIKGSLRLFVSCCSGLLKGRISSVVCS